MIKKIRIIGALWLWVITLAAQTNNSLTTFQYWWDDNLPVGEQTISGSTITYTEPVDTKTLNDGFHRFNYRIKDNRGAWSQTVSTYFLKRTGVPTTANTVDSLQYWWNDDFASKTQKPVTRGGMVEINDFGDATALKDGFYRFNYRIKDNRGAWSQTATTFFLKRTNVPTTANSLVTLQYWWDGDYASLVEEVLPQPEALISLDKTGAIAALSDGIHRLSYRVKDNRNQWSSTETYAFIKYGANFTEPEIRINDGMIYQFFDAKLTWNEANDLCQRLGGSLATAENESDSLFIASAMKEHTGIYYYWLGDASNYYAINTGSDNLQCGRLSDNQDYPGDVIVGFILKRALGGVGSLEANLPASANIGNYKNMTLELTNDSGQRFSLTVTEKLKYVFNGIPAGPYQLTLKNKYGAIVGQVSDITIADGFQTVTFSSLLPVYKVQLAVTGNQDPAGQATVKWYDENETLLSTGDSITGTVSGMVLNYQIGFNEALGKLYVLPPMQSYTVIAGNNTIAYALEKIPVVTIEGQVRTEDRGLIQGAVITVSQLLNGKYSKIITGTTDRDGKFSMQVNNDSSTIIVSYPNYLNQTLLRSNFNEATDLGTISLSPVKGAIVTLNLAFTPSLSAGETPGAQSWYSDYQNVDYALFNVTQGISIDNSVVQYPDIVLLDGADINDEIRITASSRTNAFDPVQSLVKLDELLRATAQLNIVQRGSIRAIYTVSGNSGNIGILYDAAGRWMNQYAYMGNTLQTGDLPDGTYRLVSMGNSSFFNTLQNLSAFASIGLKQNTDYDLQTVTVKSGTITAVTVPSIPGLDESQWYYTGNNTSFSVNKSSVTAGNYLTLRSAIDFKDESRSKVSNVRLLVDLPETCAFVAGSIMIGNTIATVYTFEDNRLTLPLTNYSDIVKFCVIPTQGGDYAPNAFVQFDMDGKTILQPIGTAPFRVENMGLSVPSLTAQKNIPVRGVTTANSDIKVYDSDMLIGQTKASATGNWSLQADLYKPYALSYHNIHAEAETPQGLTLQSEVKEVTHNVSAIEVSKVTMINVAHPASSLDLCEYVSVFDFLNPDKTPTIYWYWLQYPDFTFKIEFTTSDTAKVSNVELFVKTTSGSVFNLPTTYDSNKGYWVASGKFDANNLPVNVSVDYLADTEPLMDRDYLNENYDFFDILKNDYSEEVLSTDSIIADIDAELAKENIDYTKVCDLYRNLGDNLGIKSSIGDNSLEGMSEDEIKSYIEQLTMQSDELISATDTLNFGKFTESSIYGTYSFIESEIERSITLSTCQGINEMELESLGFVKYNTTNSNPIYVKVLDNYYQYIDFERNVNIIMPVEAEDTSLLRNDNLRSSNSLDQLLSFIKKMGEIIVEVQGKYSLIDLFNERIAIEFDKALAEVEKNYRASQSLRESFFDLSSEVIIDDNSLSKAFKEEKQLAKQYRDLLSSRKAWDKCFQQVTAVLGFINDCIAYKKELEEYVSLYNSVPECPCHPDRSQDLKNEILGKGLLSGAYYVASFTTDGMAISGAFATVLAAPATGGTSLAGTAVCIAKIIGQMGLNYLYDWSSKKTKEKLSNDVEALQWAMHSYCNDCGPDPNPNPGDGNGGGGGSSWGGTGNRSGESGGVDKGVQLDPSGYVYEAVTSNRLPGVTASVYYETEVEDMYGDRVKKSVLWDADNYEQVNPQITDEYGQYSWFVPIGLWQVKYEKDGYEPVYSDWLPVPPPQLDVNIAMVQATHPEVQNVKGYESGITIEFSKFMMPATLGTESIFVTFNDEPVPGSIVFLNEEVNPHNSEESFVSKVRFVTETPFNAGDEVVLTVKQEVKSYAGIMMAEDFVQRIVIQKEVKSLIVPTVLNLLTNEKGRLEVSALPQDAAAGKKITVRSVSPSIATVSKEAVLDAAGTAILDITGELPGTTLFYVSLDETDLKEEITVKVTIPQPEAVEQVEKPTASIPSGSTVEKNTTVRFSSNTAGATIYYTLDGSVPSAASGLKYSQPIAITEDVTIRAIAVKEGMTDSETAVFEYYVQEGPVVPPSTNEQVAKPSASIPSGSTVEKNTTVTLSSATAGATIYFTLDGSDPSAASGLKYLQPIVIPDDVTIRAIAVKEGMLDSDPAVFEYYVSVITGIPVVKDPSQYRMFISPNPVRSGKPCKVLFNIPDNALKDFYISVYSTSGEKVYENQRLIPVVEITGLRQGSYIIRLSDIKGRNYHTQKIIVIN